MVNPSHKSDGALGLEVCALVLEVCTKAFREKKKKEDTSLIAGFCKWRNLEGKFDSIHSCAVKVHTLQFLKGSKLQRLLCLTRKMYVREKIHGGH